ncbi:AbrB family transcriptional regulator [Neorhizobium petrolearium]|uniref:AbrB family transcriptional regulator n=1 Tax=Neorhizobium petrolearium TaxID=515361 RepID=A0ABY8M2S3_9HYPH|nr:AbrB family transcriptional regulator [Neorhizobium petrolearium]MCC2608589.1 AbrB family transcriptional regulator [Neorhizobium petrolearium]WGI68853.1 AbrB family transcriptional regulator [Neorhizobium petrolearium]
MSFSELRASALTALIGTAGALIAIAVAFPAPYLIGPAVAITVAGLAGLRLTVPAEVRNVCFVIIGVSMGASVTPEVIVAARTWPASFVMVPVAVVILLYVSSWMLQRFFRYDRVTALLASSPGHLSYVLSLAAETHCDLRTVSVAQSVRVLALTITTPLIVEIFGLVGAEPALPPHVMSVPVLIATLAVSALLGMLFLRWRLPAALLLGGVAVSISTHITGFVSGGVPNWLLIPTYVILGSVIGTRFCGVSIGELRVAFVAGGIVTVVVTVLAAAIAGGVSYLTGVPLDAALIAFAPGGLETMAAMAVMLHADPTYVGAHHVLRLMFLSVLMPLVLGKEARQR